MEFIDIFNAMAAIAGSIAFIGYCRKGWASLQNARAKEKDDERKFIEYYKSLGEQSDAARRAELYSILSMKALVSLRSQIYVQNLGANALHLTTIMLLFVILSDSLLKPFFLILAIVFVVLHTVGDYFIERNVDRANLKISAFLESVEKDLLDKEFN